MFDKFKSNLNPFPEVDFTQGKSIAHSKSTTSRIMEVLDANGHGNVHGGVILRMADEAAAIVAMKHAQRPVVTARIDRFDFLAPAFIGNVVSINCNLNYVGRSSLEVAVEVSAEDLFTGEIRMIAVSQITFVALNEEGKPTPVPPLIPANAEEQIIIDKAITRRNKLKQILGNDGQ